MDIKYPALILMINYPFTPHRRVKSSGLGTVKSKGAFDGPCSGIRIRGVMIKTVCWACFEAVRIIKQIIKKNILADV